MCASSEVIIRVHAMTEVRTSCDLTEYGHLLGMLDRDLRTIKFRIPQKAHHHHLQSKNAERKPTNFPATTVSSCRSSKSIKRHTNPWRVFQSKWLAHISVLSTEAGRNQQVANGSMGAVPVNVTPHMFQAVFWGSRVPWFRRRSIFSDASEISLNTAVRSILKPRRNSAYLTKNSNLITVEFFRSRGILDEARTCALVSFSRVYNFSEMR